MTHQFFVLASYGVAALGLGAILAWLLLDGRRQQTALRRLQKLRQDTRPGTGRQEQP